MARGRGRVWAGRRKGEGVLRQDIGIFGTRVPDSRRKYSTTRHNSIAKIIICRSFDVYSHHYQPDINLKATAVRMNESWRPEFFLVVTAQQCYIAT